MIIRMSRRVWMWSRCKEADVSALGYGYDQVPLGNGRRRSVFATPTLQLSRRMRRAIRPRDGTFSPLARQ